MNLLKIYLSTHFAIFNAPVLPILELDLNKVAKGKRNLFVIAAYETLAREHWTC